jgi:hypothetical protein
MAAKPNEQPETVKAGDIVNTSVQNSKMPKRMKSPVQANQKFLGKATQNDTQRRIHKIVAVMVVW